METVIIVLQIVCVTGLALGTALSLHEIIRRSDSEAKRFDHAVANDFETGYRRLARSRR